LGGVFDRSNDPRVNGGASVGMRRPIEGTFRAEVLPHQLSAVNIILFNMNVRNIGIQIATF
ncbi:MAG: hypothetical protein COB65_13290, partial [Thalassobium sp.]